MSSTAFESIFNKSDDNNSSNNETEAESKLNKLFTKKPQKQNINTAQIINTINDLKDGLYGKQKQEQNEEKNLSRREKAKLKAEKENRTVFVGNLPKQIKKENLMKLFKPYGKIEAIRFRNVIPEDQSKSKKFAFITKQTFAQVKSMNAFVRFNDLECAKKALEVNGKEFEGHHLRVDMANGGKTHDNKRSVFLGGLSFLIEDETLYKHFSGCGDIDSVRVIRDNRTGIGKGIGYVTFKENASVSLALKLNNSEIDNRKIRVERCVKKQKKSKLLKLAAAKNNAAISKKSKQSTKKSSRDAVDDKTNKRKPAKKMDKKLAERKKMSQIKTNRRPTNKFKF